MNQAELAEQLGMSRIPVRDALHSLAAEGLVSLKAHSSAWVRPLSEDELEDLYEIRIALEPGLCRVAVPRLTADDVEKLATTLERLESADSEEAWLAGNDRFHALIYRKSGRPRSVEIVDRARESTRRYTTLFHLLSPGEIDMEHRLILEAVRRSQSRRVESLVVAHLSSGYEAMMAAVKDSELTRLVAAGD